MEERSIACSANPLNNSHHISISADSSSAVFCCSTQDERPDRNNDDYGYSVADETGNMIFSQQQSILNVWDDDDEDIDDEESLPTSRPQTHDDVVDPEINNSAS